MNDYLLKGTVGESTVTDVSQRIIRLMAFSGNEGTGRKLH